MKTVGVITYHHSKYSYGASLQAFATLRAIEKLGYYAELINYDNAYEQAEVKPDMTIHSRLLSYCKLMVRLYFLGGEKCPYRHSNVLDHVYRNVSSKHYSSVKDMEDVVYDTIIVGSDQVWNRHISGGLDDAFLLQFGHADNKLSYASSLGSVTLTEREKEKFKRAFADFSSISVREEFAAKQLQPLTDKKIKVVLDPTMLLTADEWRNQFGISNKSSDQKPGGYVLIYLIGNYSGQWEKSKAYAQSINLQIWNVQYHAFKRHPEIDKVIYAASLGEFIDMVDHAEVVITNSFHGTAFSILLHKKFVTVLSNNPERVKNLLNQIGLENRIEVPLERVLEPINYEEVDKKVEALRTDSLNWLNNAIESHHE